MDGDVGLGIIGYENFFINIFEIDLIDRGYLSSISESSISYKLTGIGDEQIFKIEWQNVGLDPYYDISELNYINFQLWLYKNGNIEFHYGPNYIDNGMLSTFIGLMKISPTNEELLFLKGDSHNTTLTNNVNFLYQAPSS
jgi:hypothetical protein